LDYVLPTGQEREREGGQIAGGRDGRKESWKERKGNKSDEVGIGGREEEVGRIDGRTNESKTDGYEERNECAQISKLEYRRKNIRVGMREI
jgi:hypothetical protein